MEAANDRRRLSPVQRIGALFAAMALGVGGFLVVDAAGTDPGTDTYGAHVSDECVADAARIADEQAEQVAELGADAPVTGFWFPESCFE